jgi:chaperone modulatory protein CbpM
MMDRIEICHHVGIEWPELRFWIESGWIYQAGGIAGFTEADEARARLIKDLNGRMGINREGIAVILDLLDQIHGLRRLLTAYRLQQEPDAAIARGDDTLAARR